MLEKRTAVTLAVDDFSQSWLSCANKTSLIVSPKKSEIPICIMKKQNHLARLLSWTSALATVLFVSQTRADIVYNNATNDTGVIFAQSGYEFGDEVVLAGGGNRFLTNFTFQYFATNFIGGEQLRLRIYRNDGAAYGTNFNEPGTMLYDSGFFTNINDTAGTTLTFNNANSGFAVPVPSNFTWTVEFSGLTNGQSAGLFLYDPVSTGGNYDQYWELSGIGGTWAYRSGGSTNINFAAIAEALPVVSGGANPTVKVSTPANKAKVFSPTFTKAVPVSGTAKDDVKVGLVLYKMATESYFKPAVTADAWAHWSATNGIWVYGTNNYFSVKSVDLMGNESAVTTYQYTLKVTNLLTLGITQPAGTSNYMKIPGSLSSGWAEVGKTYTLTAMPGPDGKSLFTNWTSLTGGYGSTNAKYSFSMTTNLNLTANFVTNRFYDVTGSYQGLFAFGGTNVIFTNSGFFTVKITAKPGKLPKFSTKVTVNGKKWGGSGTVQLNGTGDLKKQISRTAQSASLSNLLVHIVLPMDGSDEIGGTVSEVGGWVSDMSGYRTLITNVFDSQYTMVIPGFSTNIGDGYGLLTITNGIIKLTGGKLADNQNFKQTGLSVSKNGEWPLFSSGDKVSGIYNSMIMGWVTVSNAPTLGLSTPNLVWIKKSGVSTYISGFTNEVGLVSSTYGGDPGSNAVITLPYGGGTIGTVTLTDGGLDSQLDNSIALLTSSGKNKFSVTNKIYKLSLSLTPKTGKLSGSFQAPTNGVAKASIGGAVLTNQNVGKGYFLQTSPSNGVISGTFLLH